MVTARTYLKASHFRKPLLLLLQTTLFSEAGRLGWQLQAWALSSNHYRFVALSPLNAGTLKDLLHSNPRNTRTARRRIA